MNQITLTDGARSIVFPAETQHGWLFHNLKGWYGQTADKVPTEERPQADGAFDVDYSLRTSRAVSFLVAYRNGTPEEVEEAVEDLSSFGSGGPILIALSDARGNTQRKVTVDSIPDLDNTRSYTGDMMVGLVARDSRRYSVVEQVVATPPASAGQGRVWPAVWPLIWPGGGSDGRITLTNTGKAASAPRFTLAGGFGTALITCVETGSRVGLNRPVPAGGFVDIDTADARAVMNGESDVSRWLQYREWELVPPGSSRTFQFDVTAAVGDPTLTGGLRSAWQ